MEDKRIDKAATWVLTAFAGIAFSLGGWFFSGLATEFKGLAGEVRGLREDLGRITTRLSVLEAGSFDSRLRGLEGVGSDRRIVAIEARIEKLEGKR